MGTKNYPKDTPSCDDQDYLSTVSKFTADDFTSCHSVAVTRDAESAEAETTTHHLEAAGQEEPEESLDTVQIIEAGEEENQEKAGEEEVEQEEEPVVIRQCVRVEVSDSEEDEEEEEVPQEEQFRNNYRQVCSLTQLLFLYCFQNNCCIEKNPTKMPLAE